MHLILAYPVLFPPLQKILRILVVRIATGACVPLVRGASPTGNLIPNPRVALFHFLVAPQDVPFNKMQISYKNVPGKLEKPGF